MRYSYLVIAAIIMLFVSAVSFLLHSPETGIYTVLVALFTLKLSDRE